ncbi:ABC transporter permease [Planctobacterium marinum]|uniref:ABC transporter permease n=1 Tax=Planctobacterium marinum TaxID=1631968 RepID=UPI001E3D5104|nr:FtsX-like permease family protein [Planctobacterium marinum]MCC2603851.1 ABC transporter permease [Planctobacterium marinum]
MNASLELGPIFRTLLRNKMGALLIALQIAVTMTIVVNAIFIIDEREALMARVSGVDEADSFYVNSNGFASDFDNPNTIQEDLRQIRALPSVRNVTTINAIPISGGGWSMSLQTEAGEGKDDVATAVYMVDHHGLEALDVQLLAGQNFTEQELRYRDGSEEGWPQNIIITQALANDLFPDTAIDEVIGKTTYINNDEPMQIIGVIDALQAPWIGWEQLENTMLSPEYFAFNNSTTYFVRAQDGMRDQAMRAVEEYLAQRANERLVRGMESFENVRNESYGFHAAMIKILTIVMATLVLITGMGIVGLASFNVNKRKKQIGTRRALGATQWQIVRYFMLENFMITSIGVLTGAALSIGLNILLVNFFELNRISWYYIPIGMLCLWVLGQLAVLGPAKKAANIPPAMATRTV